MIEALPRAESGLAAFGSTRSDALRLMFFLMPDSICRISSRSLNTLSAAVSSFIAVSDSELVHGSNHEHSMMVFRMSRYSADFAWLNVVAMTSTCISLPSGRWRTRWGLPSESIWASL